MIPLTRWTQQVIKEMKAMREIGMTAYHNTPCQYARRHADEYENECMSVGDCAQLMYELSSLDNRKE